MFACVFASFNVPYMCRFLQRPENSTRSSELDIQMAMDHPMWVLGNDPILCHSIKCSSPASHLSSPPSKSYCFSQNYNICIPFLSYIAHSRDCFIAQRAHEKGVQGECKREIALHFSCTAGHWACSVLLEQSVSNHTLTYRRALEQLSQP